jgi:hypothetical protein
MKELSWSAAKGRVGNAGLDVLQKPETKIDFYYRFAAC